MFDKAAAGRKCFVGYQSRKPSEEFGAGLRNQPRSCGLLAACVRQNFLKCVAHKWRDLFPTARGLYTAVNS